jgi:hypothetical protein
VPAAQIHFDHIGDRHITGAAAAAEIGMPVFHVVIRVSLIPDEIDRILLHNAAVTKNVARRVRRTMQDGMAQLLRMP